MPEEPLHSQTSPHRPLLLPSISLMLAMAAVLPLTHIICLKPTAHTHTKPALAPAALIDLSSAKDTPDHANILRNIHAWKMLRTPDFISQPNTAYGFLNAIPEYPFAPQLTKGFGHALEQRQTDFKDSRFTGMRVSTPTLTTNGVYFNGGRVTLPAIPRTWTPDFRSCQRSFPFEPEKKLSGIIWADDCGARLNPAPTLPPVTDAQRATAGITRLELVPEQGLQLPRIVLRSSCGNSELDAMALQALNDDLRRRLRVTPFDSADASFAGLFLNIIWNLK